MLSFLLKNYAMSFTPTFPLSFSGYLTQNHNVAAGISAEMHFAFKVFLNFLCASHKEIHLQRIKVQQQ